jgi:hypothetical protein
MPFSPWWLLLLVPFLFSLYFRLTNPKAYAQKRDQVVMRRPGKRHLGPPEDARPEARKHLEFAWMSQAAYEESTTKVKRAPSDCPDADASLHDRGWERLKDFPTDYMPAQFAESHLRVQVWMNSTEKALAVSFGGTVFTSGKDWKSNLRWFTFKHNDEDTQLVRLFVPRFAEHVARLVKDPECAFLRNARFCATGHSLGGGLAQQLAYAQKHVAGIPRITFVFAFDPSPVAGFYTVPKALRDHNKCGLLIERIYERGEILALLRSFMSFIYPPSAKDPTIVHPIAGHSMSELACKLNQAASGTLTN